MSRVADLEARRTIDDRVVTGVPIACSTQGDAFTRALVRGRVCSERDPRNEALILELACSRETPVPMKSRGE